MQRAKRSHSPRSSKPTSSSSSKKFRSAGQIAGVTSSPSPKNNSSTTMLGENRFNPSTRTPSTNLTFPLPPYGKTTTPNTTTMDDRSSVSDNDSVHSPHSRNDLSGHHSNVMGGSTDDKPKPAPGKKTRGRVKIEMQYIQNKLRRYTTFSKRKSGIMKKAYELSTLTGTQVMLLVASETGHVYTFATPKLQPMITSEAGKALIQTCLHTPDPPQPIDYDIRMSATGYEETELGYGMSDEEAFKSGLEATTATGHPVPQVLTSGSVVIPPGMMQMPFAAQVAHPEHHQSLGSIMPPSAYSMAVSSGPTMSPHSHSPPPSYSPSAHNSGSPRNYPNSPPNISYSQASHLPPQHMIMDDLVAGGSPLRKSPSETHYLSHHHYDRSPSHSPMTAQFPMRTHSPPHQIYSNNSPTHHSPIGGHM